MVGIARGGVVLQILLGTAAQAARHVQQVCDADLAARVTWSWPLWDRCGLVQRIDALLDQYAEQRRNQALAHRPTGQRRLRRDALGVALREQPPLPDHDERRRS